MKVTDVGLSIRPSGLAAGFIEDTFFNLTCHSNRLGNFTWALTVHSSDELDNIQIKVTKYYYSYLLMAIIYVKYFSFRFQMIYLNAPTYRLIVKEIGFRHHSNRIESQEIRFRTLHLSPSWHRSSWLVKMLFSLQIDLSVKSYFNWSFADFKGIAIRHPKSGEYRCGAVKSTARALYPNGLSTVFSSSMVYSPN